MIYLILTLVAFFIGEVIVTRKQIKHLKSLTEKVKNL